MNRSFLLLQGMCTPYFSLLGKALSEHGHAVHKVNFNGGDALYWRAGKALAYRGNQDEAAAFYADAFKQTGATDLVLFGDCRPLHLPAIDLAERTGVRVHVFEEGYFRPYWVTLERHGVNARSRLPRDPDWYREAGRAVPDYGNGEAFESSFWIRAWHDVAYHIGNISNPLFYPNYCTHAPVTAPVEYLAYLRRALILPRAARLDAQTIAKLAFHKRRFWLLPLQLNSDAQIKVHSPFDDMFEVIEHTIASFAKAAPPSDYLIIKNHPLDTGLCNYAKHIDTVGQKFGIAPRVVYLETGHLPTLLNHARGVVTVNSTVGGSALVHSRPTIALANAIYNMPGLTFQGSLDDFWLSAEPPDPALFTDFRNVVIHTTQLNGGFYSRSGMHMAIRNSLPRLTAERSPLEALASDLR
ncbi:capsule biosynthesis protein [Bordetella petrii]|uniref:Capsular biosynthesis protein n=1 Tax=Bordetella petrii TaxID=94624 RepID=A0ABT7VXV2_9BORD|nr:capsular biosynthesis protein [Bordetella petrii]MDM9557764.1 capsular biosynthesis protein [Bordetella petrii]